jgi:hypothetical protein
MLLIIIYIKAVIIDTMKVVPENVPSNLPAKRIKTIEDIPADIKCIEVLKAVLYGGILKICLYFPPCFTTINKFSNRMINIAVAGPKNIMLGKTMAKPTDTPP